MSCLARVPHPSAPTSSSAASPNPCLRQSCRFARRLPAATASLKKSMDFGKFNGNLSGLPKIRLVASVAQLVEQLTLNQLVLGSSPSRGTIFPQQIEENGASRTDSAQNPAECEELNVKWPKRVKHRNKVLATIYNKSANYAFYRVVYTVDGKRMMKSFAQYSGDKGAKKWTEEKVSELASGSKAAALTARQADDALAAMRHLQCFYEDTGKRVTLLESVSGYCAAAKQLGPHTMSDCVAGFLGTVAVVARKALSEAVAEFNESRKHLAESKDGKRSKRSPVYAYNVAMWLKEFAGTFPGHAVCDLTKDLLNAYIGGFKELSAKSRNDRRAVVKMFLRWCVAKDYLSQSHRLFDAVDFKTEDADVTDIDFYRPKELRDMLDAAATGLRPVIALGGLAGLRREEILRIEWADVWRVSGKVEISAKIAKGRKRRLVSICAALAKWLRPYRHATGQVWGKSADTLEEAFAKLRTTTSVPARRNGLRHSFITFHMAMHANENLTAAEAGNSPQMLHEHYRALAPRRDAVKWFQVKPSRATDAENVIQFGKAAAE